MPMVEVGRELMEKFDEVRKLIGNRFMIGVSVERVIVDVRLYLYGRLMGSLYDGLGVERLDWEI